MNSYLKKYGFQSPKILEVPSADLGIIVVIPCHNETKTVLSLESLKKCEKPKCAVKTILVINQSEVVTKEISVQNENTYKEVMFWKTTNLDFDLEVIFEKSLPKKHAGVGLARKIGMDEAVHVFHQIDEDGIIVALDSDCTVDANYLKEIESHFHVNFKTPGCSIRYAHPLEGNKFEKEIYSGITNYELHLRYYNQALEFCKLPYAFHTVGSSMAVKSSAYQKQGGMNKRKAGEDFYFLQKIIELGNFTELNSTCVIPSPRISDRVPFGTGKAIGDWVEANNVTYFTYNFTSFIELKKLVEDIPRIYESDIYQSNSPCIQGFIKSINFENKIAEIKKNTTNYSNFTKRFFTFFNAFTVLKFVHFARDNYYPNLSVTEESKKLLTQVFHYDNENNTNKELLHLFREIEKSDFLGN